MDALCAQCPVRVLFLRSVLLYLSLGSAASVIFNIKLHKKGNFFALFIFV